MWVNLIMEYRFSSEICIAIVQRFGDEGMVHTFYSFRLLVLGMRRNIKANKLANIRFTYFGII